jgi:CMP-N-acetylneuraminic acid synthetase
MTVLGVIPARGGSKAIPGKNLAMVGGRPLILHTCEAARASARLTRVVLSTDDPRIAEVGARCGIEVPFLRPAALARDETPIVDVLRHVVAELEGREGYRADAVALLQPTSPLRRPEHIDRAVDLLHESGADSIVSVVAVPHQFNPVSVLRLVEGRLTPFLDGPLVTRRQDKPPVYARNGPAVLVVRRTVLVDGGRLYGDDTRALVMTPEESIDVDEPLDLAIAELLLLRRHEAAAGGRA